MRFASVCSGVSPHSQALSKLGWRSVFTAEVEPFPCLVLHHRYGCGRPWRMPSPHSHPSQFKDKTQEDGSILTARQQARREARKKAAAIREVRELPLSEVNPNLGDMTKIDGAKWRGLVDWLLASCPCQSFSVAGLRKGLKDHRGNITMSYVELLNDIDPMGTLFENVPGILSDRTNAFGCLLGGLVGADTALVCPRGLKWSNAGYAFGPRRRVAWRVLDAQGFVPQRRRRVFVVALRNDLRLDPRRVLFESQAEIERGLGDCEDTAQILSKLQGLRWDTATGTEAGQGATGDAQDGTGVRGIEIGPSGGGFTDLSCTLDARCKDGAIRNQIGMLAGVPEVVGTLSDGAHNGGGLTDRMPTREESSPCWPEVAMPVMARDYKGPRNYQDGGLQNAVVTGGSFDVAHSLRADGFDASEDGTGRGTPLVPVEVCPTLRAGGNQTGGDRPPGTDVDTCDSLIPICFSAKDHGADAAQELSPTLRSGEFDKSHQNGGVMPAVCYAVRTAQTSANGHGVDEDVTHALDGAQGQAITYPILEAGARTGKSTDDPRAGMGVGSPDDPMFTLQSGKQHAVAFQERGRDGGRRVETQEELAYALTAPNGGGRRQEFKVSTQMAVRRLPPIECCRLQGWEDCFLHIPTGKWRKITADEAEYLESHGIVCECREGQWFTQTPADGNMYKAIGNGWCVDEIEWIARRIESQVAEVRS